MLAISQQLMRYQPFYPSCAHAVCEPWIADIDIIDGLLELTFPTSLSHVNLRGVTPTMKALAFFTTMPLNYDKLTCPSTCHVHVAFFIKFPDHSSSLTQSFSSSRLARSFPLSLSFRTISSHIQLQNPDHSHNLLVVPALAILWPRLVCVL